MNGGQPPQGPPPGPPPEPDSQTLEAIKDIEEVIQSMVKDGLNSAVALSGHEKEEFQRFTQLKTGRGPLLGDPNDPLVQKGIHLQDLAKFIDILRSLIMTEIIPDVAEMDFFEMRAKSMGLDDWAEAVTNLMRDRFKTMKPESGENYYQILDRMADDLLTYGTCFGTVTSEVIEGDDGDEMLQGPCVQYIDPHNVWPWRTDVNCLDQTNVTIYDPITCEELEQGNYVNVKEVYENETKSEGRMRDRKSEDQSSFNERSGVQPDLFEKFCAFIQWPFYDIRERLKDKGSIQNMLQMAVGQGVDSYEAEQAIDELVILTL